MPIASYIFGYYSTDKDYTAVREAHLSIKAKFYAAFECFSEEVLQKNLLDDVKKKIIEFIEDNLQKIDTEATTEHCLVSVKDNLGIVEIAKAVSCLKEEIDAVEDDESLRVLLQQYCCLSNFSLLKYLADMLDLTESKERIDGLTDERDGFYTSLLAEDFANAKLTNHEIMDKHEEVCNMFA